MTSPSPNSDSSVTRAPGDPKEPAIVKPATLLASIDDRVRKVRTRSQDISFNELLSMYKEGDLIIRPIYQRLFRWDRGRQSRFMESLVLEMPVPPIFVIEDEDGRYELIDGLQRISSYLHFRGELKAPEQGINQGDFLELEDCDILKELNGMKYTDLPTSLDLKLKRHFTRVEVVRKESDPSLRYHMFKRLNTGGELLSDQELRNCTIRMLNGTFIDAVADMARDEEFQKCIEYLSEERKRNLYDQELVLRFFAFKNWRKAYVHDIGEFLTKYMEGVTDGSLSFDYALEKAAFGKTFKLLRLAMGPDAFARTNDKGTLIQTFSPIHYEAVVVALQGFLEHLNPDDAATSTKIGDALKAIKKSAEFRAMTTGGGRNFAKLLEQRISFVVVELQKTLGGVETAV